MPDWKNPVEVTWNQDSSTDRDYISEAVNKVCDIDAQGEPGDMLVFLSCPAETERACEVARDALKNEAVVLPLHDNLPPEELNKIFTTMPKGKRKVIFSTNLAETSVTIPGIVYVIDTGVSKELCHDPITNVNTFEMQPISKSSADQRRNRAGQTSQGECYRLYSTEDYADMQDDSVPEILHISLAAVVAKLYKFGIRDVYSFEFVEPPSKKALDMAIENLKFLGAIKDGELTALGEKIAFLPIDPSLAKVLIDAISEGVGTVAAAAVAISTLAGSVYFSSYSVEFQFRKRVRPLPFCQQSGDQITHLHAYYEWHHHGRKKNAKWGLENYYINVNSMQMVKQIVEELRFALKQINAKIPGEFTINSLTKADKILPKLFFDAFSRNMCVHLGHPQAWYWSEDFPDERLVSSSLHYLTSTPQCVVYEKTQKTSQHFLLHALPVREEWIQEALVSGKLPCHPAQCSWFKCYRVAPLLFTNLGGTVMSKLQQKYPQSSNFLDSKIEPVLEYIQNQGTLRVFAQLEHHNRISSLITDYADSVKEELKEESYQRSMRKFDEDVEIVISAGACVQHVLISDDYQAVIVRGLSQMLVPEVEQELKQYGPCITNTSYRGSREQGVLLYVQYTNRSDAEKALQHKLYMQGLRVQRYKEYNKHPSSITVKWWRRQRKGMHAQFVDSHLTDYLSRCSITTDESGLNFNPTLEKGSVLITGIHVGMTDEEVLQRLFVNFPPCKDKVSTYNTLYSDGFKETGASYSKLRNQLDKMLTEFADKRDYTMKFDRPNPIGHFYEASVSFEDSVLCCTLITRVCGGLLEDLHTDSASGCIGAKLTLELPILYQIQVSLSSSTRYPPHVFRVIRPSVQHVCDHYQSSKYVTVKCDVLDRFEHGFVDITATDLGAFTEAKKMVAEAVGPETLSFHTYPYLSTGSFQKAITDIQSQTSTYIELSYHLTTSSVDIYGTKSRRERAKDEVELHLRNMIKNGVTRFEVKLKEYAPSLMKHLVREHGSGMANLPKALEGITATKLNPRRQILTLFATETGYENFLFSLAKFETANIAPQGRSLDKNTTTEYECCMCFETQHSKIPYRLEYCGHVFCRECLEQQLEPDSIEFPVTCAAENCEKQFVWKDFENLLMGDFHDITIASFKSYISTNPEKIRSCVTPGCDMVYAVSSNGKRVVCRHCRANICSQCNTTWHDGFDSCEAYKSFSRGDTDSKQCPELSCSANI